MKTISAKFLAALLAVSFFAPLASCDSNGGLVIFLADGRRATSGYLYVISPGTEARPVGPIRDPNDPDSFFPIGGMTFGPDGKLYAVTNRLRWTDDESVDELVTINPANGAVTPIGDLVQAGPTNWGPFKGITFIGSTLYAVRSQSSSGGGVGNQMVTINTSTGVVTPITANNPGSYGNGLVYDEEEDELLIAANGEAGDLEIVDPADGSTTTKVTLTGDGGNADPISSLTFAQIAGERVLLGVLGSYNRDATYLISIDTTNGDVTEEVAIPAGIEAIAVR